MEGTAGAENGLLQVDASSGGDARLKRVSFKGTCSQGSRVKGFLEDSLSEAQPSLVESNKGRQKPHKSVMIHLPSTGYDSSQWSKTLNKRDLNTALQQRFKKSLKELESTPYVND